MIYIFYKKDYPIHIFIEYINNIIYTYKENFNGEICFIDDLDSLNSKIKEQKASDRFLFIQIIPIKFDTDLRFYLINTEQLSRPDWLEQTLKYPKNIKIIDYSLENIEYLKPYRSSIYLPYTVNPNEIFNYTKIHNICSVMYSKEYRNVIKNDLIKKNISVNHIEGYGNNRDTFLFKHKILLNVHFDETYEVFETIRCNRCVMNKMIVITQKIKKEGSYGAFQKIRNHMIECEYDELVNKVIEVSNNYDEYYHKLFDNFNLEEIKKEYEKEFINAINTINL
jgi:hypothetical protein